MNTYYRASNVLKCDFPIFDKAFRIFKFYSFLLNKINSILIIVNLSGVQFAFMYVCSIILCRDINIHKNLKLFPILLKQTAGECKQKDIYVV